MCNFLQTIDKISFVTLAECLSVEPYTRSRFSRFLTPSINQSLLGATENKISLPIWNFFF